MEIVEQLERDKAELQADKARLQAENDELRRNLGSTLKSETCDSHLDKRPISIRQPAVGMLQPAVHSDDDLSVPRTLPGAVDGRTRVRVS